MTTDTDNGLFEENNVWIMTENCTFPSSTPQMSSCFLFVTTGSSLLSGSNFTLQIIKKIAISFDKLLLNRKVN